MKSFIAAACLTVAGSAFAAQDLSASRLDPARLGWNEVQLKAAKLFMKADATIRVATLSPDSLDRPLLTPGQGNALPATGRVLAMNYSTDALGRHTEVELLLDPISGAALQRTSIDSGNKQRFRIYRFTESGAWHQTQWPTAQETGLPREEWTDYSEGLRAYPIPTKGDPVAESTGLIYIAAAAPLEEPGDQLEILTYARRHLHRVSMTVAPPKGIEVDYRQTDSTGLSEVNDKIAPIRILIDSETVGEDADDEEFDMLGLKGDIELLLDPETRLPLQLSGDAKIVGRINFRVTSAVLR